MLAEKEHDKYVAVSFICIFTALFWYPAGNHHSVLTENCFVHQRVCE